MYGEKMYKKSYVKSQTVPPTMQPFSYAKANSSIGIIQQYWFDPENGVGKYYC